MRRPFAAVAIAVVVLMHAPAFARAATRTTKTTTAPAAPAVAIKLTVGNKPAGTLARAALRPGSSTAMHLTATNTNQVDRLEVSLTTSDADLRADGTVAARAASGASAPPGGSAASWLSLGDTAISLAPGASVDVPLNVSVPPETAGGAVAAMVKATVTDAAPVGSAATRQDAALKGQTATVGVRIDVQAPKRAELNVSAVSVAREKNARRVQITIANAGTTAAPLTGTLTLEAPNADKPVDVPIRVTVPARAEASVKVPWPKSVSTDGVVTASVKVHHGSDNAEWSGRLDPSAKPTNVVATPKVAESSTSSGGGGGGLGVPLWVIGAILLAVVWLGYEVVAASRERKVQPIPTAVLTGAIPYAGSGAAGRLHEELEPLVTAISALARTIQPQPDGAPAPLDVQEPVGPDGEVSVQLELEPIVESRPFRPDAPYDGLPLEEVPFDDAEADDGPDEYEEFPLEAMQAVDAIVIETPIVATPVADASDMRWIEHLNVPLYDYEVEEPGDHVVPVIVTEPVVHDELVVAPEPEAVAFADPASAGEPDPWEPQAIVTQILEILGRIDPRPSMISIHEPDVIEVLAPDELVEAVASALTVAPATVRHWLSDDTLNAVTHAPDGGRLDAEQLVRERQVLAAQVEVLKRALSDLG